MVWELSIFRNATDEFVSSVDLPGLDTAAVRNLLGLGESAEVVGEVQVTGEALKKLSRYTSLPTDLDNYAFYLGYTADPPTSRGPRS